MSANRSQNKSSRVLCSGEKEKTRLNRAAANCACCSHQSDVCVCLAGNSDKMGLISEIAIRSAQRWLTHYLSHLFARLRQML